jgi:hypothetical protein
MLFDINRQFIDNKLTFNIQSIIDLEYSGKLFEFGANYDILESLNGAFIVNKIFGDKLQGDSYPFNNMEGFSHMRVEIYYYY